MKPLLEGTRANGQTWPSPTAGGPSALDAMRLMRLFGNSACAPMDGGPAPLPAPAAFTATPLALDSGWPRRQVDGLPVLPQAIREALQVLQCDESGPDDCAASLVRDPVITARVLRLANSAFYGRAGRVATVQDAVVLLGRRTLGKLLNSAAVSAQFSELSVRGLDLRRFWRHVFGTAIAAQWLATELGSDDALAYNAGLLHDIGHLVLVAHAPDALAATVARSRLDDRPREVIERLMLGTDHAQIGGMVAEHWQFPAPVVAAIVGHHADPGPDAGTVVSLTDLVRVADTITHVLGLGGGVGESVPDIDPATFKRLGLPAASYQRVFERTETGAAALAQELAL